MTNFTNHFLQPYPRHHYLPRILTSDEIDKSTYEFRKVIDSPIDNVEELVEELPDNSARYILLSYPMKLPDGRIKSPFVMLYWRPPTCGQESKMLYAGAVELMREKAGVSQYVFDFERLGPLY